MNVLFLARNCVYSFNKTKGGKMLFLWPFVPLSQMAVAIETTVNCLYFIVNNAARFGVIMVGSSGCLITPVLDLTQLILFMYAYTVFL